MNIPQDAHQSPASPQKMEPTEGVADPRAANTSPTAPPSPPAASPPTEAPQDRPIPPSSLPPSPSTADDDITKKTFQFLSTATPGTLGAMAVGFGAVTYLALGQLGLVLIGAFGGVALFLQWEARNPEVSRAVRGERGVDVLARLLDLKKERAPTASEGTDMDLDEQERVLAQSFADFQPQTKEALGSLVDAVIGDYVKWWYSPILPADRSFPLSCRKVLTSFIGSVSNHLGRKRPADSFLDFLTNSSSIVIVFFSELSAAFSEMPPDSSMTAADAVYHYLASNPNSSLANLLSQKQQAGKFRVIAEDLLGFLDRSTYDCDPARTFLREVLAGVILEMTLQTCSKPAWINGWIVYLLEAGEPDFSQAIDVGMQTGPDLNPAFADIDGNIGNISLTKGNRNSFEMEKARRKESLVHKKKLSRADEEMEEAMEEMKRMNRMFADEEARRVRESVDATQTPGRPSAERKASGPEAGRAPQTTSTPGAGTAATQSPGMTGSLSPTKEVSSDGRSSRDEAVLTPATPGTTESSQRSSPSNNSSDQSQFTSFDQIVPPTKDEPEERDGATRKPPPLTLHNATITILDDGIADNGRLRNKPTSEYLIQVEPSSTHYPGWMTVRKFADFEKLHEVLRRIATISSATAFAEQHSALPNWKVHTRASLRGELERYVRDACWYQSLAESEGLKRFLEKDQGHERGESKSGFLGLETMGKNMLDVLAIAPKGVAEGGRAITGGITGVFGNIGLGARKLASSSSLDLTSSASRLSISSPPRMDSMGSSRKARDSLDSTRSSVVSTQPGKIAPMERRPSHNSPGDLDGENLRPSRSDRWDRPSPGALASREHSRASSLAPLRSPFQSPSTASLDLTRLPPPPDAMPDDCDSPGSPVMRLQESAMYQNASHTSTTSISAVLDQSKKPASPDAPARKPARQFAKLSEQETRVAVELTFAIINEMYTLSSAWNIRRTLLAAAKSFLLRPGNPSLVSIQSMIQESVIDANTSDAGIAAHLRKLRENTLPTEEERKAWPAELTDEEREKLRVKARRMLIQSGVPAALMGVMGQSATSEALGRVFDCLQIEEVARGLIFGIMLQAVRVITH